jgi:hypothetical protein
MSLLSRSPLGSTVVKAGLAAVGLTPALPGLCRARPEVPAAQARHVGNDAMAG